MPWGVRGWIDGQIGGRGLNIAEDLVLQVLAAADEDEEELAEVTRRLRVHLLDLDVDSVLPLVEAIDPDGAKGMGAVIGALLIRFGTPDGLRSLLAAVAGWATRTGHNIEISYGKDILKVSGVTPAQQERIISDFLSRHAPRP